jgi:cell wall assembly regulator SMI1
VIERTWYRVEAWLMTNAPLVFESLHAGASEAEIVEVEHILGVRFPDDVRASYGIHAGQHPVSVRGFPGLIEGYQLLTLPEIMGEWRLWKRLLDGGDFEGLLGDPQGPIRADWWHPAWIPLTHDGSGNHHMLDLSPAPGGTLGQILEFWHDDPTRRVLAPSFAVWLDRFADDLNAGRYIYSAQYAALDREE